MDWYYPVLGGVVLGDAGQGPPGRPLRHLLATRARASAACRDRPWITVAETCECALAHLAVGDRDTAERALRAGPQQLRATTTAATGPAPSTRRTSHFPAGERSTYTAAAVILAADALAGKSPASALFIDHDACCPSSSTCREGTTRREGSAPAEHPEGADRGDLFEAAGLERRAVDLVVRGLATVGGVRRTRRGCRTCRRGDRMRRPEARSRAGRGSAPWPPSMKRKASGVRPGRGQRVGESPTTATTVPSRPASWIVLRKIGGACPSSRRRGRPGRARATPSPAGSPPSRGGGRR